VSYFILLAVLSSMGPHIHPAIFGREPSLELKHPSVSFPADAGIEGDGVGTNGRERHLEF
jgi:hypothetical protein